MTATFSVTSRNITGTRRTHVVTMTFDDSYPTGGESYTAADLGLGRVEGVAVATGAGGYVAQVDSVNSKVELYEAGADGGPLDEFANAGDASAITVGLIATGF